MFFCCFYFFTRVLGSHQAWFRFTEFIFQILRTRLDVSKYWKKRRKNNKNSCCWLFLAFFLRQNQKSSVFTAHFFFFTKFWFLQKLTLKKKPGKKFQIRESKIRTLSQCFFVHKIKKKKWAECSPTVFFSTRVFTCLCCFLRERLDLTVLLGPSLFLYL